MKKIWLFCTEWWLYLIEIPLIALLVVSCIFTGKTNVMLSLIFFEINIGLIPLILILSAAIVFVFLFFFRFISLSFGFVKSWGVFSSRDSAVINEGKKLILTLKRFGRIKVELFGNDGIPPMYDGADEPIDIYLFRGRAIGGKRAVARVLGFYGVSNEDIQLILKDDSFSSKYECVQLESCLKEDIREVTLTFTKTV